MLIAAHPPHRTASSGPDEADTKEPPAKNTTTIDPSGPTDTEKKLKANEAKGKSEDKEKDEQKDKKKDEKKK